MSRSASGSVAFQSYQKGKMAGVDPLLWSVDQVIDQLCSWNSSLYTDQLPQIKRNFNVEVLRNAIRDNDIDGDALLALEDANIKDDLGFTSFGQRRELVKMIKHLQEISDLFKENNKKVLKRRIESEDEEDEPDRRTPESQPETKKRRIQPELLSTMPISTPEDFDPNRLSEFDLAFLERHRQVSDTESLRPYGESDQELEIDSDDSLFGDLESENESTPSPQLPPDEVNQIIDEAIEEFQQSWTANKQPNKHKKAFKNWMRAAKAGTRKPQQNALQAEIAAYENRLEKFRNGIHDMSKESKVEDVKQMCQALQVTVEAITERQYFLHVLESNEAPPKPAVVPVPVQAVPEDLGEDEEILESETETEEEEEADQFVDDASASGSDVSLLYDPADDDWNPQLPLESTSERIEIIPAAVAVTNIVPQHSQQPSSTYAVVSPRPKTSTLTDYTTPAYYPPLPTPTPVLIQTPNMKSVMPKVRQGAPNLLEVVQNSIQDQMDEEPEIDLFEDRLPQTRYRLQGATLDDAIDLGSSPASSEYSVSNSIHTPPLNPETPTKHAESRRPLPPRFPSIQKTRNMKYREIGDNPFLLLCKSVYKRNRTVAREVLGKIKDLGPSEVASALRAIISEWQDTVDEDEIFEEGENDTDLVWTYFYIVFASGTYARSIEDVSEESLDIAFNQVSTKAIKFDKILRPLLHWYVNTETTLNDDNKERSFTQQDKRTKQTNGGFDDRPFAVSTFVAGPRKSPTPITDTESDLEMVPSGSQKRKRHVTQSQEALKRQRDDRNRVEAEEEQRRHLMMQRFQAFTGNDNIAPIPINFKEPIVYLDHHIARRVKPHQIEGIQFIWRELVADPNHQGCLLAHTMGLGKTMQVVSFLVTLARVNQDPHLQQHLPSHLRSNKVLIMCPASLVDNWYDEISMWTPPGLTSLGAVYRIHGTRKQKIETVEAWNRMSGILIVGYESLRALLKKHSSMSDEDSAYIEKSLLTDPCVVVADEAHKLKNTKSEVNKVAMQVATGSRIALTGSPLNNHLEEYHTMINWIAPEYLGTLTQFKAKYSEPIERGLYADSSRYDKRKSLEKLYVLKRDLAPKIDRKDISAIAKDMPQKTEFFITVPLTEIQRKIYTTMVEYILRAVSSNNNDNTQAIKSTNAQLWAWLSILSWLCNHPSCLIKKLEEKEAENAGTGNATLSNLESIDDADFDEDSVPENFDLTKSPLLTLLPRFKEYFKDIDREDYKEDPDLSTRSTVTRLLIEESVAQGDKILVFSHSIPTLNFLQSMVLGMGLECMRIDGSTKTDQRQNATKYFNDQDSKISVFLISTRAGGLGLNLQGANRVIIYDFGFNPSWEEQAIGRAYRLGQKKPVFVYRFRAGGTFEETMYNKAIFKTQLFSRVVDQKNVIRHASKKIEDYLFVPKEAEKQDLSECLGKDALLDKVVQQKPDAIRGLILTETFQREDEDDEMTPEERTAAEEAYKLEQLARKNPQEYQRALAIRAQAQQAQRIQTQQALLAMGGQKTTFEQTWNTKTINAAGPTPRPTQSAVDEGFEVVESNSLSSKDSSDALACRNQ